MDRRKVAKVNVHLPEALTGSLLTAVLHEPG